MSYWYLATPYKLYPAGKQAAYEAARYVSARLLSAGIPIYSPIVHNHPLSVLIPERDGDFDFWVRQADEPLMEGAGGLLVCMMESWEISAGVLYEIEKFRRMNKPVVFYDPDPRKLALSPEHLPRLERSLEVVLAEERLWQDETFPLSTSASRAEHLRREAEELAKDPENPEEMADVLLLLSHLARGKGGPGVSLVRAVLSKQEKNRAREWGKPDCDGVVEHIRRSPDEPR